MPEFTRPAVLLLTVALGGVAAAESAADAVSYTFSFTGATGSLGDTSFEAADVSYTLFADTEDVQPGSPRGFNVTPLSGTVSVGDVVTDIGAVLIANSAVWTYTSDEQGLRIGFGIYDPFESFTSGSYDGPLGWNMTASFAGAAVGDESILRAIQDDGIETLAGTLLVTAYASTSFSSTVVPAPPVAVAMLGLAAAGRTGRRRR